MTTATPRFSKSTGPGRYSRIERILLTTSTLLGALHLLVAVPHFIVRLMRGSPIEAFGGIDNFVMVNQRMWRGSAPATEGYAALARAGVVTVIDLRAEADTVAAGAAAAAAGLQWLHVPIRDGQPPASAQVTTIANTIEPANGPVFVHCQAGVGRTGSVIAALRISDGRSPRAALVEALRIGPMSLEQQVFILRSQPEHAAASLLPVTVTSRLIDSPRRAWSRLTG